VRTHRKKTGVIDKQNELAPAEQTGERKNKSRDREGAKGVVFIVPFSVFRKDNQSRKIAMHSMDYSLPFLFLCGLCCFARDIFAKRRLGGSLALTFADSHSISR